MLSGTNSLLMWKGLFNRIPGGDATGCNDTKTALNQ